jgi:hypothetical protein
MNEGRKNLIFFLTGAAVLAQDLARIPGVSGLAYSPRTGGLLSSTGTRARAGTFWP